MPLHVRIQYMYICMNVCIIYFFSLNHFRVLEVSCPYTPKYFSVYMLGARKSILLHNLSAVINSGNLSLILHCYLTYSSYSNFINYFNGMLYSYMYFLPGLGSKSTYGIKLSSFFTLCWSVMVSSIFPWSWHFLKMTSQVFNRMSFSYETNIFLTGGYVGNRVRSGSEQRLHR